MIEGVVMKTLRSIPDERGCLTEMLRSDDEVFERFGQAYVTTTYPGVVKAWHMHKGQTDYLACVRGHAKIVLYDGREDSKTKGEVMEVDSTEEKPFGVKVPPGVWHGFKSIGGITMITNTPTSLFDYENPDEHRLPPDTDEIPYDWKLKPGLKHG